MKTKRTPDERFEMLAGYSFAPHYAEIADGDGGSMRVHSLDAGSPDAAPALLLHGEPSWSYLYRHMIPPLVAAGHRVIAPDLVGFGRSDKPTGHGPASEAFLAWQKFSQESPVFPIGQIVNGATTTDLTDDVIGGHDAPFPDDSYMAGARIFPTLVPTSPDDPASADDVAAWEVLSVFEKPFLLCFSDQDAVTRGGDAPFLAKVPGAKGQPHVTIEGGGHFLQEDRGPELARVLIDFIAS